MQPRTTNIEHLITDLRKQHPRLIVVVGEQHDSLHTRKLLKKILKGADAGFYETPNTDGSPAGRLYTHEEVQQRISSKRHRRSSPAHRELTEAMLLPKTNVFVDANDPPERREALLNLFKEVERLEDRGYGIEHEKFRTALEKLTIARRERLHTSNTAMGKTIGEYMKTNVSPKAPFFGVLLVGSAHLSDLETFGLEKTEADLRHTLAETGCKIVTIGITPHPQYGPRMRPGDYLIGTDLIKPELDYTINIIDPECLTTKNKGK